MTSDARYLGPTRWVVWRVLQLAYALVAPVLFRPRVEGAEGVPPGGFLLLGNHTSALDNLWIAAPVGRPTHIMSSAGLFRNPVVGAVLRTLNCFPKRVGTRDDDALDALRHRLEHGQIVQIMPEGVRTWDGRLMEIRPGIGSLVQDLGATVVVCRTATGHLWWPRWGTWPRWVPVHLAYEQLGPWGDDATPEQIWREIVAALDPPVNPTPTRSYGVRLAEGLESYLYACPACFSLGATETRGNALSCRSCDARWQVDVHQHLEGTSSLWLREAWDRLADHFGPLPRQSDEHVLTDEGEVLEDRHAVHEGTIVLDEDRLHGGSWSLTVDQIRSVYMDTGNVLMLRTRSGGHVELRPRGSTWMWFTFLSPRLPR